MSSKSAHSRANDLVFLALTSWSLGEEIFAQEKLKEAKSICESNNVKIEENYLNFAGIFPGWLKLLMDEDFHVDDVLLANSWHSHQFLENKEVASQFFNKYPYLLESYLEGSQAQFYDEDDENYEITLGWLPSTLKGGLAEDLLTKYGDAQKQALHFIEIYQSMKDLSNGDPILEEFLVQYMDNQQFDEDEKQGALVIFKSHQDKALLQELPKGKEPNRPMKI